MPNIEVFIGAKNEYIKYSITRLLKVPELPNGKFSAYRQRESPWTVHGPLPRATGRTAQSFTRFSDQNVCVTSWSMWEAGKLAACCVCAAG